MASTEAEAGASTEAGVGATSATVSGWEASFLEVLDEDTDFLDTEAVPLGLSYNIKYTKKTCFLRANELINGKLRPK